MRLMSLDLGQFFNNVGITSDQARELGDFDSHGASYPFEDVRHLVGDPIGLSSTTDGTGRPDNVVCERQLVCFPSPVPVEAYIVLGAGEGSVRDRLTMIRDDGEQLYTRVGLTDFVAGGCAFGECCPAVASHLHRWGHDIVGPRPRLWRATIRIDPIPCVQLVLPLNPLLHVFALTLVCSDLAGE